MLRIEEARAQRAIAAAAFWPTLSLDAAFTRQRFSETTPTGSLFSSVGNIHLPGGASMSIPNPYNQFQLSAGAAWEIDLFGRIRRSVEAADAAQQVSVEDHRAVMVSVLADVAQSYMELRGAQARLRVAQENLATIDELLDLTRQRLAAGLTTHIDVSNAMAQADVTRAELPAFELQITQSTNQLSQLLGREPEALRAELQGEQPVPSPPSEVSIGLPAELARRRPDIREAEANLHAATAQIGVAVADLFPRLSLGASGGFQSETTGTLLEWASRFGSLGPTLDLPIFDRGRWKTVQLYDVRAQEAALAYRRTVLAALHEVENALAAYGAGPAAARLVGCHGRSESRCFGSVAAALRERCNQFHRCAGCRAHTSAERALAHRQHDQRHHRSRAVVPSAGRRMGAGFDARSGRRLEMGRRKSGRSPGRPGKARAASRRRAPPPGI